MIDECYYRAYGEARAELNTGIADLLGMFVRSLRKTRSQHTGEMPCAPDPSSLPHSRCR